jgi:hypothetical protein
MLNARHARSLRSYLLADRLASPFCIAAVELNRRVIPLSRSRHVRGWHPVRPGHGAIGFESLLERRVIDLLATYSELIRITSQPVTVTYREDRSTRWYTPDFFVDLAEVPIELAEIGFGQRTYVEVKPYIEALNIRERLSRRFAVMTDATDLPVVLITDLDLPAIGQEVRHGT